MCVVSLIITFIGFFVHHTFLFCFLPPLLSVQICRWSVCGILIMYARMQVIINVVDRIKQKKTDGLGYLILVGSLSFSNYYIVFLFFFFSFFFFFFFCHYRIKASNHTTDLFWVERVISIKLHDWIVHISAHTYISSMSCLELSSLYMIA